EVRKVLGYLPQEFGVYPKVSAEEMLDHFAVLKGIHNKKERKEVVAALLQQTNLYDVRKKNLGGYSGGMKQRFGIAQALLGNPQIIIVDEPTAGLDPAERNRFHNLLSEIGENVIVILSTHIVEDVTDLCRNFAIINKGEVLLTGDPREVIADLNGKIWRKFIHRDELPQHQLEHDVISSRLYAGQTIIHVLNDMPPATDFEAVEPDLEDVYFSKIHLAQQQKQKPTTEAPAEVVA
ncbi:MAG: ATP-binding cassette domain-containing protein, partial [Hymenobacteraceae bacterium]|nr:ATP-binding cassette domain-containing protein [Hymenobacteraceae bacterium]MDX5395891.1 ATP-binding cassette domain-containing protein [Hymenobacteraceae bacterium]MDX5511946.1 ATP-binding cassette domain-containing protein [Hymenobacteraceae bacterium]